MTFPFQLAQPGPSAHVAGKSGPYYGQGQSSVRPPAPAAAPAPTGETAPAGQGAGDPIVITDPNRLVPVQITIPAQPGNPTSHPRALTVQVPAHALQPTSATSTLLQQVLTQAITQALTLPESHAAIFLQNRINNAFNLS